MLRGVIVGIACVVVLVAVGIPAILLWRWSPSPDGPPGASVTVLIDFSHSFIPLRAQGRSAGLLEIDSRALRAVARALARLAWETWKPPVKIVWSPITAGATVAPFCPPLVINVHIVRQPGAVAKPEEIERALLDCVDEVVRASQDITRLATHTDISAAVAGASSSPATYGENVLVILSDFKEDLAGGQSPAKFAVSGHKVILLHRPGTDEPEEVDGYLARVNGWKEKLRLAGSPPPAVIPVFAASNNRVRLALRPDALKPMTSLAIVVDPSVNVLRGSNASARGEMLVRLGQELTKVPEAQGWKPPISAQWTVTARSGLELHTQATSEFDPTDLIPKLGETAADFATGMGESSRWASAFRPPAGAIDMLGAVKLVSSLNPAAGLQVAVILSDFAASPPPAAFQPPANSRFVLLHTPGPERDESKDNERRQVWTQVFGGQDHVCLVPLATWTSVDLAACFTDRMPR